MLLGKALSWLIGPIYAGIIHLEIFFIRSCERIAGSKRKPKLEQLGQLTVMIKTFERPKIVARLIRSIKEHYPEVSILVVEDSKEPRPIEGVKWLILPFDSGVSAGRQAGLMAVATPYILVLDDDFVFYSKTDLGKALEAMEKYPEIDLMGGAMVNLPLFRVSCYRRAGLNTSMLESIYPKGTKIGSYEVYDKVPNFYIARTDRLRLVGWDPRIKRLDHAEFFTRAKGVLLTVYNPEFCCLHAKTLFNRKYMKYRNDLEGDYQVIREKYSSC